jgi:hypothetical protein
LHGAHLDTPDRDVDRGRRRIVVPPVVGSSPWRARGSKGRGRQGRAPHLSDDRHGIAVAIGEIGDVLADWSRLRR